MKRPIGILVPALLTALLFGACTTLPPTWDAVAAETRIAGDIYAALTVEATATPGAPTPTPETPHIATTTPYPTSTAWQPLCTVQLQGLYLRYGPGIAYSPPVGALTLGTQLIPLAYAPSGYPAGQWIQVQLFATGQVGWVSAAPQYVTCNLNLDVLPAVIAPPTPIPPAVPLATATRTRVPIVTLPPAFTATATPVPIITLPPAATATATPLPIIVLPAATATPVPPTWTPQPPTAAPASGNTIPLPAGAHPNGMAFDPDHGLLWVSGRDSNTLYAIDTGSAQIVAALPVGSLPFGVAYVNGLVFVANFGSNTVSVIDAGSRQRIAEVSVAGYGTQPSHVAADAARARVYVALHGTPAGGIPYKNVVSITTGLSIAASEGIGTGTFGIAVLPNAVFSTQRDSRTVIGLDPGSLSTIEAQSDRLLGGSPFVAASDGGSSLYVTHSAQGAAPDQPAQVSLYSSDGAGLHRVRTIDTGALGAAGGAITVFWGRVWLATANSVVVWDHDLTAQIRAFDASSGLGSNPVAIAGDAVRGRVYVADGAASKITILQP